jgi:C_GCAxxG_C_C family probable redox protein
MTDEPARMSGEFFQSGYYCAESVLMAIAVHRGVHSDLIPRIATGFCGGMSRTNGTCGAVSGAIMSLGLALGRNSPDESVDTAYTATRKLLDRFGRTFGSTNCRQLLGCDLGTPEGQATYRADNLIVQCRHYTEEATRIALSILSEGRT